MTDGPEERHHTDEEYAALEQGLTQAIKNLEHERDELKAKLGETALEWHRLDKWCNNQSIELAQLNFSFFSSKITIEKVCGYCRFCTRHYCVKREMHLTDDYLYSLGCDYFKSKV